MINFGINLYSHHHSSQRLKPEINRILGSDFSGVDKSGTSEIQILIQNPKPIFFGLQPLIRAQGY